MCRVCHLMRSELTGCVCSTFLRARTDRSDDFLRSCGAPVRSYPIDCQDGREVGGFIGPTDPMPSDRKTCQDIHWLVHICRSRGASHLEAVEIPSDFIFLPIDCV